MLKSVSSITNAIGALNFKGTWNASTNTPTLASGVGTKGDYFVVGVAGTTTLDGISTWGVGDWATYNGSVWQRVEGGADLEGVNLNVSGTTNLAALTASTALALDASKNVVSVTNTGTGSNVLASSPSIATPTLTGDVQISTGNLVIGTSGKGIDFSATPGTGTSELLADYEEGDWTPVANGITYAGGTIGKYTKIGNLVTCTFTVVFPATADVSNAQIQSLPFTASVNSAATFGNYSSGFNGTLGSGNAFIGLTNTTGTAFITNATLSGQTLVGLISYQV
jgi:hypothetical protein